MSIYEKLAFIQQELVAPKGQRNDFGKYNYRSCEDIEKALKPLLQKYRAAVVMDGGEMRNLGDRYYMVVTILFIDLETGEQFKVSSTVREDEKHAGMTGEMVSGCQISYARKYALAGLFLIDNEKDADTNEYTKKRNDAIEEEKHQDEVEFVRGQVISENKVKVLQKMCQTDKVDIYKLCALYKVNSLSELTEEKFVNINSHWGKVKETCQ